MRRKDLLGRDLSEDEAELMDLHERMLRLGSKKDLAPCLRANLRFATAALHQAVQDLGLDWLQPEEEGL